MKIIPSVFKVNRKVFLIMLLFIMIGITSCSKDDDPAIQPIATIIPEEEIELSNEKQITSFVFLLTNNPIEVNVVATIDEENRTITAALPPGTDITGLLPEVKLSELATVDRDTAQDFTEPLEYEVTAEDSSTTVYTVTITALLTQRQILQAILDANPGNTLTWDLNLTENLGDIDGITLNTQGEIIDLTLDGGAISVIPVEIGQLTSLEFLNLDRNPLTTLIPEIGQLTSLIELSLFVCDFSQLPPEIGLLTNLKFLGIAVNNLSSIPPEIGKLKKLEKLYLNSNQITSLPAEIGQLTNLELLRLDFNELTEIPPEIGLLTKLKTLLLGSNQHTELPPEIGQLRNLTELDVYNTQLTSLPPEIGFLGKLEKLDLTQINSISTLPESISYLVELRSLIVFSDNTIPYETTSQKDALISMYSANPGNTLGWGVDNYPEVTFHANGNPKAITMNNKNLTRIPENISSLSSLESFNVNSNNIESLPVALGSISSLVAITAASNQLSTVPSELGQLQNLALLSMTNNPITSIPQEVCNQQTSNGGILTILTDPGEGCD